MTPDPERLDADARKHLGKGILDCTFDDLRTLQEIATKESARLSAGVDQAGAAMAEAEKCGCDTFAAPRLPDGTHDLGRTQIVHTCGR